jgi:hypothetical protein
MPDPGEEEIGSCRFILPAPKDHIPAIVEMGFPVRLDAGRKGAESSGVSVSPVKF